jgi:hypothetical protein
MFIFELTSHMKQTKAKVYFSIKLPGGGQQLS